MKLRKFYRGYNPKYQNLGSRNNGWWITKNPHIAMMYTKNKNAYAVEVIYLDMDNFKCASISDLKKLDTDFSYMDQIPEQMEKVLQAGYDGFKNGDGGICLLNKNKIVKHYKMPWKEMEFKLRKMGYLYDYENNINNIPEWIQQGIDNGYDELEDHYDENGRGYDTIERIKERYIENKITLTINELKDIIVENLNKIKM